MEHEVRYCTTEDGVRIAYGVEGTGPALLLCPLITESFSSDDTVPEFKQFVRRLGKGRKLVRYDVRGTGLSDRHPSDVSHAAQIRDLEAVVAAAALYKVVIMAPTTSGPCAISFSVQHPDLVNSLILYGTYGRSRDVMSAENLQALAMLARTNWTVGAHTLSDMGGREEFASALARWAEWFRISADGDMVARILEARNEVDVLDILPCVGCPTLVLHRPKDPAIPFQSAQALAAGIPGARLVPLPGRGHNIALGETEAVLRAIEGFLSQVAPRERDREPRKAKHGVRGFATILFTDVEGSTALTQRLGDAKARELLREHERMVREALKAHGGSEVKTMGDGFMTSFSSATKALECAIAMQRAFAAHNESAPEPIEVRVGLNAGEPIAEDEDLFGTAVNRAARIAAMAQGGEILVANVVRELAEGKEFMFGDRGETALRGFDDPVRLFEVRWS